MIKTLVKTNVFCYHHHMEELWQLYSEQGVRLEGKGATKDVVFNNGLLHAASHVWIWRKNGTELEVLLQKRAATKRTWPNRLDISAAGHVNLGEEPLQAALREIREEIGLKICPDQLDMIERVKTYMRAENGAIEYEFQWIYLLKLPVEFHFELQQEEVDSLIWKKLNDFTSEFESELYVPHTKQYYLNVVSAIMIRNY